MDISKIEIILIEDNPDDAVLTIRAFQKRGLNKNVIHLKDGEEALDFIFNFKVVDGKLFSYKTKVILLDLKLPKVDGMEVLQKLKSNTNTKSIPVVILTSTDHDPTIQKCKELGASNYIVKPVTYEGFIDVVSKLDYFWSDAFRF